LRRRKTGGGRASSHADAQIAPSLPAFSPIRYAGRGCARRAKWPASICSRRSGKRDATWTSRPIVAGGPTASSARKTRPAMIGGRSSAARTLQISSNSRNPDWRGCAAHAVHEVRRIISRVIRTLETQSTRSKDEIRSAPPTFRNRVSWVRCRSPAPNLQRSQYVADSARMSAHVGSPI
jgi:hypothetical protein